MLFFIHCVHVCIYTTTVQECHNLRLLTLLANVLVTDSRPGAESPAPVCARMYCVCRCQYSHAMITFNHSSSEITNPTTKIPEAGTRLPKMAGKTASVSSTTVCTRRAETVANTNFLPNCMQTSAYLLRNTNKQI